jgi:two-component system response regulator GlrR
MIQSNRETQSIVVRGRQMTRVTVDGFSVVVRSGPDRGRSAGQVAGSLTIGNDSSCDLVLSDPAVSRFHLRITSCEEGARVEDLGSKNGCWLNGVKIATAVVRTEGQLQLGSTVINLKLKPTNLDFCVEDESSFFGMISQNRRMREIFSFVRQLAKFDVPVAITGETGTGKELIARALHDCGLVPSRPFRILDCGSVVKELLASELFGHEKGAFTGADRRRPGVFEEADGGTVFLDEIGEMDMSLQPHLLRVLENREVIRVGSSNSVPVKFRLVSATNRNLSALVSQGKFRQDLLYRLSAVTIVLPSLRERPEDIPPLVEKFAEVCASRNGVPVRSFTPDAMSELRRQSWPGNVRELKNVVEGLAASCDTGVVDRARVEEFLSTCHRPFSQPPASPDIQGGTMSLDETERLALQRTLEAVGGNRTKAAQVLGISRSTLWEKMRRYGLDRKARRNEPA